MLKQLYITIVFFFILIPVYKLGAQYLPKDGAKLNYNQVKFSFPKNDNVKTYTLTILIDSTKSENDLTPYLFKKVITKSNELIVENFDYGQKYKWFVESTFKSNVIKKSDTHYFSLYYCPYADTSKYKFKQHYNKNNKIQNGLIWLDQMHCAIDRNLNIVWFLPPINADFKEDKQIRDFRLYTDGTITFLSEGEAYHINKDCEIIWQAPNDGNVSAEKKENYHHSFEKLDNGNYLVLGNQFVELENTDSKDTSTQKVEFTTVIEYNKKKEVVWSWKMLDHFPIDLLANENSNGIYNTHCNSVSLSKNGLTLLLGYRDISRIIEIDKASGKIIRSFGKKLNSKDTSIYSSDYFLFPHDAKYLNNDNEIGLINNNDVKNSKTSSFDIYKIPNRKDKDLKRIFNFNFKYDQYSSGQSSKLGNFIITNNNRNVLINEGATARIIEIEKQSKELLWDMEIYKNYSPGGWKLFPVYRIHFQK